MHPLGVAPRAISFIAPPQYAITPLPRETTSVARSEVTMGKSSSSVSHEIDHGEPGFEHRKHNEFGIAISIYHHRVDVSDIDPFLLDKAGSLSQCLLGTRNINEKMYFHWDDSPNSSPWNMYVCVSRFPTRPFSDWLLTFGSRALGWRNQSNFVPACSGFGVVKFSTQFKGYLVAPV